MITTTKITDIQRKIKLAIAQIEKEENVKISFGSIRYSNAEYGTKMTVKTLDTDNPEVERTYKAECATLGLTQNVIGMQFQGGRGLCTVSAIKLANRKYPIIASCSDGKSYKYSVMQLKAYIGGDKIINRNKNLDLLLKK